MVHSHGVPNAMTAAEHDRLKQFFGAYFHQDWTEEAPDADAVIAGFLSDHPHAEELTSLAALVEAFANSKAECDLKESLFSQLGCWYVPDSDGLRVQEWLVHVAQLLRAAAGK
jgi:hypothetical protein